MFERTRTVIWLTLVVAVCAGYFGAGDYMYRMAIGLDPSAFPGGEALQSLALSVNPDLTTTVAGAIWMLLWIALAGIVGFVLVRAQVRQRAALADPARRSFLTGAALGSVGGFAAVVVAGLSGAVHALFGVGRSGDGWAGVAQGIGADVVKTHPEWKAGWKESRISGHRRFGRTGWDVSDIVLGTGQIKNGTDGERIARLAIDRGINYFDTSPDYSGAGSENLMGQAIAGVRDKLFIATKFCTPTGHLPAGSPVNHYVAAVEASLKRLRTDYVDLCHVHAVDSVDRLMDENVHEAFDRLKQQGKVRFLGFSTHTPNLVEVVNTGIDSGRFDVMMLAYHHGIWPALPQLIERARKEQDMGVVAMKTLKGAKHHGLANFRTEENAYSQAALRWVLSNPNVSAAVISFFELQHVDEYLAASGTELNADDIAILNKYDQMVAGTYCAPHCGACLDSCPEKLQIHDVLRHKMYFEDYGREKEAMRLYANLDVKASVCASCSAPCLGSCPLGIPIPQRTGEAHELLSMA
jgi:aryl-alcohol dehydrogenase-like predicted oxidoreductase